MPIGVKETSGVNVTNEVKMTNEVNVTRAQTKRAYAYRTTLKKRYGLNDAWISRLGDPDRQVTNMHYKTGPLASLYLVSRVEELIEVNKEEYAKLVTARATRSAIGHEIALCKIKELEEYAKALEITLNPFPEKLKEYTQRLNDHFNYNRRVNYDTLHVTDNAVIAMLRHNFTNYEDLLDLVQIRVGIRAAYLIIHERVNRAIVRKLDEMGYQFTDYDEVKLTLLRSVQS